jgi:hypothetical protein
VATCVSDPADVAAKNELVIIVVFMGVSEVEGEEEAAL